MRRRKGYRRRNKKFGKAALVTKPLSTIMDTSYHLSGLPGMQSYRYEHGFMCGTSGTQTGGQGYTTSTNYHSSVLQMLNRAMYDMSLRDPLHAVGWNALEAVPNGSAVPQPSNSVWSASVQQVAVLPTRGYMYQPGGIYVKFDTKVVNAYFNPTNVMQFLTLTTLARKRSQIGHVASMSVDGEIVDSFNYDLTTNLTPYASAGRMVVFDPQPGSAFDLTHILGIIRQGEVLRRYAYPRTTRYDGMPYALRNRMSTPAGLTGGWSDVLPTGYRLSTDNDLSFADQNVGQVIVVTGISNYYQTDPYQNVDGTSSSIYWERDVRFDPKRNPYLRKLFYMHQQKYKLAPGSSVVVRFGSRGKFNAVSTHLYSECQFWRNNEYGAGDWAYTGGWNPNLGGRAVPFGVPWPSTGAAPQYAYYSKKQHGLQTYDLIEQVLGQQVWSNQTGGTNVSDTQYAGTQVIVHRRNINRWNIINRNKYVTNGGFASYNGNYADPDPTHFSSSYPTYQPTINPVALPVPSNIDPSIIPNPGP